MSSVLTGIRRGGASVYDVVMYGSDGQTHYNRSVLPDKCFLLRRVTHPLNPHSHVLIKLGPPLGPVLSAMSCFTVLTPTSARQLL